MKCCWIAHIVYVDVSTILQQFIKAIDVTAFCRVIEWRVSPVILAVGIGFCSQQSADTAQVTLLCGEVKWRDISNV